MKSEDFRFNGVFFHLLFSKGRICWYFYHLVMKAFFNTLELHTLFFLLLYKVTGQVSRASYFYHLALIHR